LTVANFFGGLNEDPNYAAVEDNEFTFLQNMYWKGRVLSSRYGSEKHNSVAANSGAVCTGLFDYTYAGGGTVKFVGTFGNKIMVDNAGTWDDITGAVTITAGQNNVFTGVVFKDILIVTNGVDVPIKWAGTSNAAALGGSPPTAPYILAKWGRVFFAGMSTDRGLLRFSNVNDHETYPAENELRIFSAGDEYITGLADFRDFLLVLTNKRVYSVAANEGPGVFLSPLFVDRNKPVMVGSAHQRNFLTIGGDAVFFSPDGHIRSLAASERYGDTEEATLSKSISHSTLKAVNYTRFPQVAGAYYPDEDWIVFAVSPSGVTTNTVWLVLDLKETAGHFDPLQSRPRWTKFTGMPANAFVRRVVSGKPYLYFGDYSGFVWRMNPTLNADGGESYSKLAKTKWFDFGKAWATWSLRSFAVEAEKSDGTVTIKHFFDYVNEPASATVLSLTGGVADARWDSAVWGTDTWAGDSIVQADYRPTGRGSVIRTSFENGAANQRFGLLRYDYGLMPIGER